MGLPLHLSFFYAHSHPRPLSAEYGRIRRDLAHARPFLGPYILLIYLLLKNLCVHLPCTLQTGSYPINPKYLFLP